MDDAVVIPLAYSLQFRGTAVQVSARVLEARATAPSSVLRTSVDEGGLAGRFEAGDGYEAVLESRLVLGDDGSFDEAGSIVIGPGNIIRFRTVGGGHLAPSPDPHLEHGTAMWEIEGGEGQFKGSSGRITSNFFLSDTGEITANHLGVVFVNGSRPEALVVP
jgi:hypothetical protein